MSSSRNPSAAGRYLRTFGAAALGLAAAILLLCWIIDPTGLLRTAGAGEGRCPAGIQQGHMRYMKPLLARVFQPEEIILGSSRAALGFAPAAFPGRRVANLAVSGASIHEIDAFARQAANEPSLARAWVGLDFGAFVQSEGARPPLVFPTQGLSPRRTALRFGLADQQALKATIVAVLAPASCANPPMTQLGFQTGAAAWPSRPAAARARTRARLIWAWTAPDDERARLYSERLARLDAMLAYLKARDIDTILYLSPASPAYRAIVVETGLAPLYARWRIAISGIARRHGARLIASDTPQFLAAIPAGNCRASAREDCLFLDVTHFRPRVGEAIVRAANPPGRESP